MVHLSLYVFHNLFHSPFKKLQSGDIRTVLDRVSVTCLVLWHLYGDVKLDVELFMQMAFKQTVVIKYLRLWSESKHERNRFRLSSVLIVVHSRWHFVKFQRCSFELHLDKFAKRTFRLHAELSERPMDTPYVCRCQCEQWAWLSQNFLKTSKFILQT